MNDPPACPTEVARPMEAGVESGRATQRPRGLPPGAAEARERAVARDALGAGIRDVGDLAVQAHAHVRASAKCARGTRPAARTMNSKWARS